MGVAIRVSRLTPSGAIATGANASYVTSKFVSLSFTPEFEAGDEFTQKAADGSVCSSLKAPDTLKRVNISIALCDPDPEFTEIIAGGTLLTEVDGADTKTVGWKAPLVGVDATPNGVAIEVWSKAVAGGKVSGINRYFHWIFPYAQMHISGDRVIENGMMATNFEGWAVGNATFSTSVTALTGTKPSPAWAYTTESPIAYARVDAAPAVQGYNLVGTAV
jgi:hypothetical protein